VREQSQKLILLEDLMARVIKDGKDKLIKDFHSVISDTEELMKSVSNESG
jgi:hypothetical protein